MEKEMEEAKTKDKEYHYQCPHCYVPYVYLRDLNTHIALKHMPTRVESSRCSSLAMVPEPQEDEKGGEAICRYCLRRFSSKQKLGKHNVNEVCIKFDPERSNEDKIDESKYTSMKARRRLPTLRKCEAFEPMCSEYSRWDFEDLSFGSAPTDDNSLIIIPIYRISKPMYRFERTGSSSFKFGKLTEFAEAKDTIIYKTICSHLESINEIKIYSNSLGEAPPALKEGFFCIMGFVNVKTKKTKRGSYFALGKDSGWAIYIGQTVFLASGVYPVSLPINPINELELLIKKKTQLIPVSCASDFESPAITSCPWLSFSIDRINSIQLEELNGEQAHLAKMLMAEIDQVNKPYESVNRKNCNVHFINGLPGTGKSRLLRFLYHKAKSMGINCKVLAFTKMVANTYMEGSTIHSFFQIPFKHGKVEEKGTEANPKKGNLYNLFNLRILFIDEVCCIRKRIFNIMSKCLKRMHNPSVEFGGLLVIAAGDFNQLPPVQNNDELWDDGYVKTERGFANIKAFKHAKFYTLETCCRTYGVVDKDLIALMNLSMNESELLFPSNIMIANIDEAIEFAYKNPKSGLLDFSGNSAIICFTNYSALKVNATVLNLLNKKSGETSSIEQAIMKYAYEGAGKRNANDNRKLNRMNPLLLKAGMPLYCNTNTDEGLVNGALVIYVGESFGPRGGKKFVVQELVGNKRGMIYNIGIGKRGIPFDWGFAMTTHKAQGRTFDRVCLVFLNDQPFVHGQLTVALTRVRSLDDLRVCKDSRKCSNPIDQTIYEIANNIKAKALNKKKF